MKHNRTLLCSILLTALLGAAGCSTSKKVNIAFDLSPILKLYDDGATVDSILVQRFTQDGQYQTLGYARIDGKTATFSEKVSEPGIGKIKYCISFPKGSGSTEVLFVLEPGDITADNTSNVHGTKINDAVNEALEKLNQCVDDPQAVRALSDDFQSRQKDVATATFFAKALPKLGMERWASMLKTTSDGVKNHPLISMMSESVEKALAAQHAREAAIAPGAQYKDFRGMWEGKEYSLSDFVNQGKYVLVDFWASWCVPCRAEIPNIISVYDKYGKKGLEVIGVALWDKAEDTAKAVEDLGIPYTVFYETDDSASIAYDFRSIPQILLIGPDGTIVASDLRGEELEKTIKDILG